MNIYFHELRSYRKTTLIWIVSLSLITIMFLSVYTSFTKDVATSKKIIESLPAVVRKGLGISLNNFFTIYGLYAYLYLYVLLAGSVQAMNYGVGIFSKEFSSKTADFLYSKPTSRVNIVSQKLAAAISLILVTNIVFIAVAYLSANLISKQTLDLKLFILISATLFFVQMSFFAIGMFMSVILPKVKSVIAVSLPTVFSFFIIGTIGSIIGNQSVRYISPFKYFDTNSIIATKSYEIKYLVVELVVVLVAVLVSYYLFVHKDIRAVT
ncbi:MAG: ABC transporter permease subunit [Candidatus Saccharimonadales bacterium]